VTRINLAVVALVSGAGLLGLISCGDGGDSGGGSTAGGSATGGTGGGTTGGAGGGTTGGTGGGTTGGTGGGTTGGTGGGTTGGTGGGTTGTGGGTAASGGASYDPGECGTYPHPVTTGWPEKPASCGPVCMRFRNFCPFPLWMHTGIAPDDQRIDTGESIDVPTPSNWVSKRANASKVGPGGQVTEFVEMTINPTLNYNVTYVDWFALPVEMVGVGGSCSPTQHSTGCYMPVAEALSGCPEPQLLSGDRCRSPGNFCGGGNNDPLCHVLDSAITQCNQLGLGCPALGGNGTTGNAFGCSGFYAGNPLLCAALNRGMATSQAAVNDSDRTHFYQNPPYSTYSEWLQCKCPRVYSFPYDDVHQQGGFRACNGDELRVTWCPGDMP
jgi:hypothetical protein